MNDEDSNEGQLTREAKFPAERNPKRDLDSKFWKEVNTLGSKSLFTGLALIVWLSILDPEATYSKIHPFQTNFQRNYGGDVVITS